MAVKMTVKEYCNLFPYYWVYYFYFFQVLQLKYQLMTSLPAKYITLLKSQRNKSIQRTRQAYLGSKNMQVFRVNKHKKFSLQDKNLKANKNGKQLNRSSSLGKNTQLRLQTLTHRQFNQNKSKKDRSLWSKTCLSMNRQSYEDQKKKNEEGSNCRVIVMGNGKVQNEHFVEVKQVSDIKTFLEATYSINQHFIPVPRQYSLQYLLTQKNIPGQFLNGQTVYLKPEITLDHQNKISMKNFEIIKQIGSGGFSKVFLVKSRSNGQFYAMKLIDKEMVIKNKKKNILINERLIMEQAKHPFVIQLKYAFESDTYLVFVMEYCAGGELFGLIKKYHRLSQQVSRFYIIEILLGISYLHSQKVVYRDIKPENILLGIDGHVKIADLGLAKPNMHQGQLAYSFCGSPQYMSPEMIMQVGHTYPVDFYCIGALLYELLTGLPPFYSRDAQKIYEAVLSEQLTFPEDVPLSQECKSLLKSLLCKNPKKRLGSLYGSKQILAHPWFGKQNYQNFIDKKVSPPIEFKHLSNLKLDLEANDKHKSLLQKVLKDQKSEKSSFRLLMKNFSYNFEEVQTFPLLKQKKNIERKLTSPLRKRYHLTERSKEKENSMTETKPKTKKSGALISRNHLQTVFR